MFKGWSETSESKLVFSNKVAAKPTSSYVPIPKIEPRTMSNIIETDNIEENKVGDKESNKEVIDQEIPTELLLKGAAFLVNRLLVRIKQPIRSGNGILQVKASIDNNTDTSDEEIDDHQVVSSDDEDGYGYDYPYVIEDYIKKSPPQPCISCELLITHAPDCQDHPWHYYNYSDKIKFLTDNNLIHLLQEDSSDDREIIEEISIKDEDKVTFPECGVTTNNRPSWLELHMEQAHQKHTEITPDLKQKNESHPNEEELNFQTAIEESKIVQVKYETMRVQENLKIKIATGNSLVDQISSPEDGVFIKELEAGLEGVDLVVIFVFHVKFLSCLSQGDSDAGLSFHRVVTWLGFPMVCEVAVCDCSNDGEGDDDAPSETALDYYLGNYCWQDEPY